MRPFARRLRLRRDHGHVLACPEVVLHGHTRCRDADQVYGLLAVLFDFRHTGVLNDRWEYVLSLCARADAGPDGSAGERWQVRRLRDPMFRRLIARPRGVHAARASEVDAAEPLHH